MKTKSKNQNGKQAIKPQRITGAYPLFPFWAYHIDRNPEAPKPGYWVRLTAPATRGRDWPFHYWLPDQPEKPTAHYPFEEQPKPVKPGNGAQVRHLLNDNLTLLHGPDKDAKPVLVLDAS